MRRISGIIIMILIGCCMTMTAQEVENFVKGQLERYPQARLLDIYKSCFQDYMGAEHLVNDTASARAYLEQEIATSSPDGMMQWYSEPCGIDGNYIRVSLRTVHEGFITADMLLNAFVASANAERPSVEKWAQRWHEIVTVIDGMGLSLSATSSRDCPNLKPVIEYSRKKRVLRLPLIRSQDARFVAPLMGATIYYRLIKSIKTLIAFVS